MKKPDDDLKLDINEIFGAEESVPEPPLKEEPPAISITDATATEIKFNDLSNAPVVEPMVITIKSKMPVFIPETSVEAEVQKSLEPESAPAAEKTEVESATKEGSSMIMRPGRSAKRDPSAEDFFAAYDHFRTIFMDELKETAGPRKTAMMLVKTFEAAREKYPEVFRNANWDASGNLLEDGSLNTQRMLDNKAALDEKQADIILDTALISLLTLRLEAVEKGLSFEHLSKLKARLKKWIDEESQKDGFGKNDPKVLKRLSFFLL